MTHDRQKLVMKNSRLQSQSQTAVLPLSSTDPEAPSGPGFQLSLSAWLIGFGILAFMLFFDLVRALLFR